MHHSGVQPSPLRPSSTSLPAPLEILWQPTTLIWVMLGGEGLATLFALVPGDGQGRWIQFGLASFMIQWVLLLTLGGLYLLRARLRTVRPLLIACLTITFLVLSTWIACAAAWIVLGGEWGMSRDAWGGMVARFTAITLTVGLLGLAVFHNHWRTRQLAVRAKQAELEALQARIRPHFLFNTLNTGATLVHQRPEEAERLLLDLSDLFRAALAGPREIALAEELALTRRYLEIEGLRFGDRLRVDWRLPETLPELKVPALSIQPLVENAIRHGVEPSADGGDVSVEVAEAEGYARVTVGNALPAAPVRPTTGHQVGLSSVRARIQAMTHGRGSVQTTAADGRHTAIILVPLGD